MLTLDTRSREPIYAQLEKQIIRMINLGVYEKDSMLPSVRSVACDLGVNPNTVAKAYKELEQKDIIYTIAGRGAFVSSSNTATIHSIAKKEVRDALSDAKNAGVDKASVMEIINDLWGESK